MCGSGAWNYSTLSTVKFHIFHKNGDKNGNNTNKSRFFHVFWAKKRILEP